VAGSRARLTTLKPLATSSRHLFFPRSFAVQTLRPQDQILDTKCASAFRSVWSVSTGSAPHHHPRLHSSSLNIGFGIGLIAIRFSWRVRRSSRHGGKGGRKAEAGHEKEITSVYLNVPPPDEHPNETSQHSTSSTLHSLERSRNQRRREREPPVIIGDPTVSLFAGVWAESCEQS